MGKHPSVEKGKRENTERLHYGNGEGEVPLTHPRAELLVPLSQHERANVRCVKVGAAVGVGMRVCHVPTSIGTASSRMLRPNIATYCLGTSLRGGVGPSSSPLRLLSRQKDTTAI